MKILPLSLLASLFATSNALAETPNINYIDAGYSQVKTEDDTEFDGFTLNTSFALNDRFYVVAGYVEGDSDLSYYNLQEDPFGNGSNEFVEETVSGETTISETFVGLGYYTPISESALFTADVSYLRVDIESKATYTVIQSFNNEIYEFVDQGKSSSDANGAIARLGVLIAFNDYIEGAARIVHRRIDVNDETISDTGYALEATVHLPQNFALTAGAEFADDDRLSLRVRYYF